jgi:Leucine-rich repeat (LRR) protein
MATIYFATGGPSWSNSGGNWLTDTNECQWVQGSDGNFCGQNGTELLYLKQRNNALNGKLPNEILLLSSLTVIDLSMNQIGGTLLSGLGSMTALTFLSLDDNTLTGTLPSELGSLTALTELFLGHNSFTGILPSALGSLTELRLLHLDENFSTALCRQNLVP